MSCELKNPNSIIFKNYLKKRRISLHFSCESSVQYSYKTFAKASSTRYREVKSGSKSQVNLQSGSNINQIATNTRAFPKGFLFGAGTAAYQIEGGWDADGKGPSNWDTFLHEKPERTADSLNGDVAANSYEYYMDDINALNDMGVRIDFYFVISLFIFYRYFPNNNLSNVDLDGFLPIFDCLVTGFADW